VWRQLPFAVQLLLWVSQISRFVIDGILLSLFLIFPRRLVRSRWLWLALWTPVLVTLPWRIAGVNLMIHPTAYGDAVPAWLNQAIFLRTMLYLTAAIVVLAVSYRQLTSVNEQRRVRVLVAGTAVAFAGSIFLVWYFNFVGKGLAVDNGWILWIDAFSVNDTMRNGFSARSSKTLVKPEASSRHRSAWWRELKLLCILSLCP